MSDLVKIDFIEMPDVVVVGKTLGVDWTKVHKENPIPDFWKECMAEGVFSQLEALEGYIFNPAYVGYMTMESYTCGMLMKLGCPVPENLDVHEIMPTKVAVGWVKGKEPELYMQAHELTEKGLEEWGYMYNPDARWSMEVYVCPRFTEADENGNIVLDYYIPVIK